MSLEDYEPVAVRLARLLETLRSRNIEPRVVTVMLSQPGSDVCVFRAELWIGEQLMATGHAEEVRGQGNVNRTSHTKRPSREEMQKVQRVVNNVTITESGDLASDKQRNMIRAVCKSLGKTPPVNLDGMTKRQASAYIDELKRLEAGEQPAPPDDNYPPEEPF